MYAQQSLPGQQAALYFNNHAPNGSGSSAGSWDAFSAEEAYQQGMTADYLPKGPANGGSPLRMSLDISRAQSAPLGLPNLSSLSLDVGQHASYLAGADQRSMGWGGRPLAPQQHQTQHPQHHYQPQHHPHQPQQPQRRRSMDEFSPTPFHQPHGATSNSHNNNGYAPSHRGPRPSHHQGNGSGSARGRSHPGAPQQLHQPQQQQQQQQQHQQQHAAGGPGAQQHPRGPGCGPAGPGDARAKGQGYRRLWQQVTAVGRGGRLGEGEAPPHGEVTVEDLLECVRRLPPDASAVKAVAQGLYFLDSGALAALLKELNKAGHARRAQEIFDWLRALDPAHDLYPLSNTMTYTTMISQCGSQQALRRALELVAEMRGRGVQCNVHTYSALMNVCIKASELELAQDVYRQMLAEGCTPNLVTYNTLIDVHGKTGAWEAAVAVLDTLEAAGIQPEVRTYNTVIIACNQSSRAAEALAVYERMLAAGAQPTATTYTALISAYGKAGQLDAALQIFQDMVRRGCERNVITYSSLISACEKAGRWELALELFREMHTEGCRPNVVTYNSLIAACAQGAQWERAQELFEAMQAKGCRPDSVTFGGLIAAHDRAGHWRRALAAFEQMRALNCRPDSVVYNTVVGALWRTGLVWAQARAAQIFHAACRQGHFRLTVHTTGGGGGGGGGSGPGSPARVGGAGDMFGSGSTTPEPASAAGFFGAGGGGSPLAGGAPCSPPGPAGLSPAPSGELPASLALGAAPPAPGVVEFGMHAFTVGSAVLSLLRWACELRDRMPRDAPRADLPRGVALVINKGKPSREHTYPSIRAALVSMLAAWRSPFTLSDVPQGCRVEAAAADVADWLRTPAAEAALGSFQARAESPRGLPRDAFFQEDAAVEARCAEAFAAVRRFEEGCPAAAAPDGGGAEGAEQRRTWFRTAAGVAAAFRFPDEVVHDAFLLVERATAAGGGGGGGAPGASPAALVAACVLISAQQAGECVDPQSADETAQAAASLAPGELGAAQAAVRAALGGDTSSISALRVLKLYLERLGAEFGGAEGLAPVAGAALALLPAAVCAPALRARHPSLVAAAALLAGRRAAGVTPFWPHALLALTGLPDEEGSELCAAGEEAFAQAALPSPLAPTA